MLGKYKNFELDHAANIAGWMTYDELRWLAEQAAIHSRIVEIGSYMGRSTRALGDNTDGVVVAVDDFKGPRDINLPTMMRENIFETFIYSMADLIEMGKVVPVVADHAHVQVDFSPDMVFIDGSHHYLDVKRDIELWMPRMVSGGLICGHDYTNIYDVRKAVQELFTNYKVAHDTTIWYATI